MHTLLSCVWEVEDDALKGAPRGNRQQIGRVNTVQHARAVLFTRCHRALRLHALARDEPGGTFSMDSSACGHAGQRSAQDASSASDNPR